MATSTDADTLADQLNHERLGLSRQQAGAIIGQSWARFPRVAERASPEGTSASSDRSFAVIDWPGIAKVPAIRLP
jgi:hypothetical protein